MKVGFVDVYGKWTDIFSFLEDSTTHREIFCKRHNISIEELEKRLKDGDYDFVLNLIESDMDEIQEILNEMAKDDETTFYITFYDEKWDVIHAEKWMVVKGSG